VLETKIRDFTNDEEVRVLVRAFEEATILPSQFHHCAHIAVALTYLAEAPLDDATVRMRQMLQKFTQRHGVNVYHETVTRFWMKLLDHLATTHYRDMPLWRRINLIVERWIAADPIAAHYSRSVYQFTRRARIVDRARPFAATVLTWGRVAGNGGRRSATPEPPVPDRARGSSPLHVLMTRPRPSPGAIGSCERTGIAGP